MTDITPTAIQSDAVASPASPASPAPLPGDEALRAEYARLAAERDQLMAELAALRTGQIEPGDARLSRVWEIARRYAVGAGEIGHYNALARELDGPLATEEFEVEVRVTYSGIITVTVDAESQDDAEGIVGDMATSEIEERVDMEDMSLDDWEVRY